MSGSGHTIEVTFEAKWGPSSRLVCHHDPADEKRPCWPHDEHGERMSPEEAVREGCVYEPWFGEVGLEALGGSDKTIAFDLADAEWDGDGFTFMLGALKGEVQRVANEPVR